MPARACRPASAHLTATEISNNNKEETLLFLVLLHSDFRLAVSNNLCTILELYIFCVFVIQPQIKPTYQVNVGTYYLTTGILESVTVLTDILSWSSAFSGEAKHPNSIKVFIYQLMHKRIALKRILKFTLKQLLHVSVQSPSSGSALFELAKVTVVKIIN